ncbi:MAG: glycoside hydrolase family 97 C-terminal domain-containing protein [Exilibacterium sp.]
MARTKFKLSDRKPNTMTTALYKPSTRYPILQVLGGESEKYIAVARCSGDQWFVDAITNKDARRVAINFDFLDKNKKYIATFYQGDDKVRTKTGVSLSQRMVKPGSVIQLDLNASGGVALWLKEVGLKEEGLKEEK